MEIEIFGIVLSGFLCSGVSVAQGQEAIPPRLLDSRTVAGEGSPEVKAGRLLDAFIAALSFPAPGDDMSWRQLHDSSTSSKALLAAALIGANNPATFARAWKLFPDWSAEDQGMFVVFLSAAQDLDQVPSLLQSLPAAKSERATKLMKQSANRAVTNALGVPERRQAAMKLAERLKAEGLAFPYLLEALEKAALSAK